MVIKDIAKITDRIEIIDGQEVYVLDRYLTDKYSLNELRKIFHCKISEPIFVMLIKKLKFVRDHKSFEVILSPRSKKGNDFWPKGLVYRFEGKWRRVHLENAGCLKCDWTGEVANPSYIGLFEGLENRFELARTMEKLPSRKCPICGSELSRHAIWINGYDED